MTNGRGKLAEPAKPRSNSRVVANTIGISGGTGIAGYAATLPEGGTKAIIFLLSPALTVSIGFIWSWVAEELFSSFSNWRIERIRQKTVKLRDKISASVPTNQTAIDAAQSVIDNCDLKQSEIHRKRLDAL